MHVYRTIKFGISIKTVAIPTCAVAYTGWKKDKVSHCRVFFLMFHWLSSIVVNWPSTLSGLLVWPNRTIFTVFGCTNVQPHVVARFHVSRRFRLQIRGKQNPDRVFFRYYSMVWTKCIYIKKKQCKTF